MPGWNDETESWKQRVVPQLTAPVWDCHMAHMVTEAWWCAQHCRRAAEGIGSG